MKYFGVEADAVLESLVRVERYAHVKLIIGHQSVISLGQHH